MPRKSNQGGPGHSQGRKPGRPELTDGGVATMDAPSDSRESTQSLPPYILSAIAFSARGLSSREIGRRMSRDPATIRNWLQSHPDAVEDAVRSLTDPADVLRMHVPAAAEAYASLVKRADHDSVRLNAASAILDRVYGKPEVKPAGSGRKPISIRFVSASAVAVSIDIGGDPEPDV